MKTTLDYLNEKNKKLNLDKINELHKKIQELLEYKMFMKLRKDKITKLKLKL